MSDEIKQNPEGKSHKELRKEYTFNKLKGLGQEIIEEIEKQKVPSIKVPSRGTSNIVYDEAKRYYVLGDRYGRRSLGNVKQIRKLGQMVYVANFCKDLVQREKQLQSGKCIMFLKVGESVLKHSRNQTLLEKI